MTYPDDLPWLVEWRVGSVVHTTLPRKLVQSISTSGVTNANIVHPQMPYGCTGWRRAGETAWQPLSSVPKHWLPFLNRRRGSELDPRK